MSEKLLSLESIAFNYDPYPIGYAAPVFSPEAYREITETFPSLSLFKFLPGHGKKYSLSEVNNPAEYSLFLKHNAIWRKLHDEVKDSSFIESVLDTLIRHNVDLGLRQRFTSANTRLGNNRARLSMALQCIRFGAARTVPIKTRFEFSVLPADGGHIRPHTDSPNKLVTLVVSCIRDAEWNASCGGGTAVLRPKNVAETFNQLNRYLQFSDTEVVETLPFTPNQCVMFVKTFNSLHAVYPMTGNGTVALRKTITINIETT